MIRRSRIVTEEEKALWEQVAKQAVPLSGQRYIPTPSGTGRTRPAAPHERYAVPLPVYSGHGEEMPVGTYANIDHHTAQRVKRGEYPIDATLDLHGMSREKAHYALSNFLHAQHDRCSRCLLVITGKGRSGEGGVLRDSVPVWLSAPGLKAMVLALDTAKPQHGGSGAYYILLRRRRS